MTSNKWTRKNLEAIHIALIIPNNEHFSFHFKQKTTFGISEVFPSYMIDHELELEFEFSIDNDRNIETLLVIRLLDFSLLHSIMVNISPVKSGVHLSFYPYHHHQTTHARFNLQIVLYAWIIWLFQ